jgi:hypothetical protein
MGSCDKMTRVQEVEESPLLEAIARELLVKTARWIRLSRCCCDV